MAEDEVYDENGVDLTVIRWFLDLSVEERFSYVDEWRTMSIALMEAFREQHVRTNSGNTR